ncbi:hypothetical protein M440DRAFT_338417 [Trichoderma longibrachiatum ATCC 18648]|uniref:Uncharacterized protein n=1 Tax=Trichoderma longibrachiatum ATCC 18648 TaxID=983965 RepID=A0A2T4C0T2_TRILO|nr:hypothetical protein M440DRAFT_338417 [Trichoderma longibrachiatum ATCC 18648]
MQALKLTMQAATPMTPSTATGCSSVRPGRWFGPPQGHSGSSTGTSPFPAETSVPHPAGSRYLHRLPLSPWHLILGHWS